MIRRLPYILFFLFAAVAGIGYGIEEASKGFMITFVVLAGLSLAGGIIMDIPKKTKK